MTERRGLKTRGTISNAVDLKLLDGLRQLSTDTKIPMSKLLDEAIEDLLKKRAAHK